MPPDAFEILGISPTFDLDPLVLRRAFLSRSAEHHPDAAGSASVHAKAGGSFAPSPAALNAAHAALADPEQRAAVLLARLGGPTKEANRSLPDGFLAEMMAAREQMQEDGTGEAARERWREWADARRDGHIARTMSLFSSCDLSGSGTNPAPLLLDIRRELNAWRYIERMIEQIDSGAADGAGGLGL